MPIKRIAPNIESKAPEKSIEFYEEFIGLKVAMDMGWIITLASASNPTAQINLIRHDESDALHPDISIEVDDVDKMYSKAEEQNIEIVYPITDEPWGVRRFCKKSKRYDCQYFKPFVMFYTYNYSFLAKDHTV